MARVLFVDDERSLRVSINAFLRADGHDVVLAEDGVEALRLAAAEPFDVVVTDLLMPRGGGIEVIEGVRGLSPSTQTVLITGRPSLDSAREAIRLGVVDYLEKPVDRDRITEVVAKAAAKKGHLDELDRLRSEQETYREQLESEVAARAAEAARQEKRFAAIAEQAAAGVCETDVDGRCTFVNGAWCRMSGLTLEEAAGDGWLRGLHPDDRDLIAAEWRSMVETGKAWRHEYRFVDGNGQAIWVAGSATPLIDENGERVGYVGVNLDITERKKAEVALRWRLALEGVVSEVSSRFVRLRGDELDGGINEALGRIGTFVGADRSYVFMFDSGSDLVSNTHEWCAGGIKPQIDSLQGIPAREKLPWFMRTMDGLKVLNVPSVDALPPEARREKAHFEAQDIRSLAVVPMVLQGRLLGFLGFDAVREKVVWSDDALLILKIVAEAIAGALVRERQQRELIGNQERYRQLFATVPDAVMILDAEGRFIDVNDAACSLYGYARDEFSRLRQSDITAEPEAFRESIVAALAGELTSGPLRFHRRRDGTTFPIEFSASTFALDGQQFFCTVIRDITERRWAEDELRRNEFLLSRAQELGHVGTWTLDIVNNALSWTDENYRVFSVPMGTRLTYETFLSRVHPDDRDYVDREWTTHMRTNDYDIEHRLLIDGEVRWVREKAEVSFDDEGQPVSAIGFTQDITDIRRAEQELREREQVLTAIFQQAAVGVAEIDTATGRFLRVNRRYCDIVGLNESEMRATDFMSITHPEDLQEDLDNMARLRAGQIGEFAMEKRYIRPDGAVVWVSLSVSPLRSPGEEPRHHVAVAEDITARKEAEQQLWERTAHLQGITDTATDAIFCKDSEYRYTFVNPAMTRLLGCAPSELLGKTPEEVFLPEDARVVREVDDRCLAGETASEIRAVTVGGREHFFHTVQTPLRDSSGDVVGECGIVRDVTAEKAAEAEVKQARREWEEIFQAIGHPTLILDREHGIVNANRAALTVTGMSLGDIRGRACHDIFHGSTTTPPTCPLRQMCRPGPAEPVGMEMEALGRTYLVSCTPVLSGEGDLRKIIHIGTDITERKQAEQALRDGERRFRELFENMGTCVAVYEAIDGGRDFVFRDINPAAAQSGGVVRDEVVGRSVQEVFPSVHEMGLFGVLQAVYRTGEPRRHPVSQYRDERILLWVENYVYRLPSGEVVAVYDDVTESRRADEQAREALRRLASAEKFAAIGRVSSGIAHEIRNPLATVRSSAEILIKLLTGPPGDSTSDPERWRTHLHRIETSVDRCTRIIEGLLGFARRDLGAVGVVDIARVIRDVVERHMSGGAGRAVRVVTTREPVDLEDMSDCPAAKGWLALAGDGQALARARSGEVDHLLANLLDNGMTAAGPEGAVVVSCQCDERGVAVCVADDGEGVAPEDLSRLFEPFFTTKEPGQGTGLGLYLCRRIVDSLGGRIECESKKGLGTLMRVWLPGPEDG